MATQTQLTQLERVMIYVNGLRDMVDELSDAHQHLRTILDQSQNAPPQGEADGSISEQQWREIRDIDVGLSKLLTAIDTAEEK